MFYTLGNMVFDIDGRSLSLIVIMEISYDLHTWKHGICYNCNGIKQQELLLW